MTVSHYYHVFCADAAHWREPVGEHLQALARGGFDGRFKVALVGPEDGRAEALALIAAQRKPDRVDCFEQGWEQHTLRMVRAEAKRKPEGITLYCHTKGASHGTGQMAHWRRSMTCALLANFGKTVETLAIFDAVGCHWLENLPSGGRGFGGNFWLARNSFLGSLPPVPVESRHQAESWIGSGDRSPAIHDLNPGYPGTVPWVTAIGWPR